MDKKLLKDTQGRPLTQSLFLELGYNLKYAIFTLGDKDRKFKGKDYISLKDRFLEAEDITEYTFANKWLLNWDHWKRLNANKLLTPHFEKWRYELELSIRSSAIQSIITESGGEKGFQAAKWLAAFTPLPPGLDYEETEALVVGQNSRMWHYREQILITEIAFTRERLAIVVSALHGTREQHGVMFGSIDEALLDRIIGFR